jgi:hypothetical protein
VSSTDSQDVLCHHTLYICHFVLLHVSSATCALLPPCCTCSALGMPSVVFLTRLPTDPASLAVMEAVAQQVGGVPARKLNHLVPGMTWFS